MATKRKWMVRSAAMLALLLMMIGLFVATDSTQAQTTVTITGRVINIITKNPVKDVEVTVDSAANTKIDKELQTVFTDAAGRFTLTLRPQDAGEPFELGLSKRSYRLRNIGDDGSLIAPAILGDIELVPRGVTTPAIPALASSPKSVYIDWEANPEIDLKGYNVWRTLSNKEGAIIPNTTVKLNGTPNNLYSGLIVGTEYTDTTVAKGQWYKYQIQAISGADRPSNLADNLYGGPERGQWLTIYYPNDPGLWYSPGGMYLWERTDGGAPEVRIPISSRCVYDVSATDFQIISDVTSQVLNGIPFRVETTGITAGIMYEASIYPEQGLENEGDHHVRIAASGTEDRDLYGTGELFTIYMNPKSVADQTCGPLHLVDRIIHQLEGEFEELDGTWFFSTGADSGDPIDLMLEDGEICNGGGCIHGDANASGAVDLEDARYILQFIATPVGAARDVYKNQCYMYAWDINLDKRVTTQDATLIMRFVEKLPINPPRGAVKTDGDTMGSFAVAGAMAEEKGDGANPSVWADIPSLAVGATANVPVYISNAAELAGFTLTVAYDATQVTLDNAALGSAFPPNDYLIVTSDNAGEDAENRSVTISVVGAEEQGNKGAYELTVLTFTRISGSTEPVPMSLTSIVINDEWGHAPRHTDPKAPIIVSGEPVIEGEGEPVVEGEGEPVVEGEGEPVVVEGEPVVVEGEGEPVVVEGEPVVAEGEGEPPVVNEDKPPQRVVKKEVPNVVGKSEAEAVAALEAAGFKSSIEKRTSKTAKGEVIEQTPAAGEQAAVGSTVKIVVSSGRRSIFSCGDAGGASGFGGDILLAALLVSLLAAAPQLRRRVN